MTPRTHQRRQRGGFTLLEVMIALGILVISLLVLVETQSTAAQMTVEAESIITATNLAQEKLSEVRMMVEFEGFQEGDVYEDGDFDDFGDKALDLEFKELADFHFEYLVTEVDLGLAGGFAGAMNNISDMMGPTPDGSPTQLPDLSMFGISEDMVVQMLEPFIREVRVRVWWGEDQDEAEEEGNEVVITTHVINPQGDLLGAAGLRNNPFGGGGNAGNAGGRGGRPNAGGGPLGQQGQFGNGAGTFLPTTPGRR